MWREKQDRYRPDAVVQFKQSWQSRKEHLVHLDHWGEERGEKKQRNSAKQIGRKVTADGKDCS